MSSMPYMETIKFQPAFFGPEGEYLGSSSLIASIKMFFRRRRRRRRRR